MPVNEKKRLLDSLSEAHLAVKATLDDATLNTLVYTGVDWRVRDILGHIATWDREVAKSLRAYQVGSGYVIPEFDEDEFNQRAVSAQRKLSTGQILDEFEEAYLELSSAIRELSVDRFPGDLLYPWGDERGNIPTLVEYMIEHAIEHKAEIKNAAQETGKN